MTPLLPQFTLPTGTPYSTYAPKGPPSFTNLNQIALTSANAPTLNQDFLRFILQTYPCHLHSTFHPRQFPLPRLTWRGNEPSHLAVHPKKDQWHVCKCCGRMRESDGYSRLRTGYSCWWSKCVARNNISPSQHTHIHTQPLTQRHTHTHVDAHAQTHIQGLTHCFSPHSVSFEIFSRLDTADASGTNATVRKTISMRSSAIVPQRREGRLGDVLMKYC